MDPGNRAVLEKRAALPHSRIMMHQPSGGAQGTAADIEIQAKEILYLRGKMHELYARLALSPSANGNKPEDAVSSSWLLPAASRSRR